MSEVEKIATRASYGNALVELGNEHDDLVVLTADLAAATMTGVFAKAKRPGTAISRERALAWLLLQGCSP